MWRAIICLFIGQLAVFGHAYAQPTEALGIVYTEPTLIFDPSQNVIQYNGSAFRLTIGEQSRWVTAAHVVHLVRKSKEFFISPARLQPDAMFERSRVDYVNGVASTNFLKIKPNYFLSANPQEILFENQKLISLSYVPNQDLRSGSGSDVSIIDRQGNFTEAGGFRLRDLVKDALTGQEKLTVNGYPYTARGAPVAMPCRFQGFTMLNGGFRGLLFCPVADEDITGASGGPVLDEKGEVVGVISAQLDVIGEPTVVYFTPLVAREGKFADGFNRAEILSRECVRTEIISRRALRAEPAGKCR